MGGKVRWGVVLGLLLGFIGTFAEANPSCPQALQSPRIQPHPAARPLEDIRELNIVTYNVLNLDRHVGKYVTAPNGKRVLVKDPRDKDRKSREEQADILEELDTDLALLQEVEGLEVLETFNEGYLAGAYLPKLIEGNDERGIEIGWLIKRDLPFEVELRTHRHVRLNGSSGEPLFSRDLPVALIRIPGEAHPVLIIVGTHYKSKRDNPGDPQSRRLRKAQVDGTVAIIQTLRKEFGEQAPILFGGDANGNVNAEAEYANLRKALALEDVFDVVQPPLTREERVTHTYHGDGQLNKNQLDILMVSQSIRSCVREARVYRYKDEKGKEKPIPTTFRRRQQNPSDHFPVFLKLDFDCLMTRWNEATNSQTQAVAPTRQ